MTGNRIDRQFQTRLTAPPERVFPLLCPIKEYDWIPQWRCEMIYSKSGVAELGCVFKTDFGDAYGAVHQQVGANQQRRESDSQPDKGHRH